ncbi:MAG: hypothetical protein ACYS0E_04325 [Planctomycetota bacterium]|jgi:hypothetical protein
MTWEREEKRGWNWGRFYLHFAAAYGTFWLFLMSVALIGQTHIDTGVFGLVGFPIIAGVYSAIRSQNPTPEDREVARLRRKVTELERA